MCKPKSQGGARCLSHMSQQISPEFGAAYKGLSLAKAGVQAAGGQTTAYKTAYAECQAAIAASDLDEDAKKAANAAVSATVADTLMSAHKHAKIEAGEMLTEGFQTKREMLREARTVSQKNLSDHLAKTSPAAVKAPQAAKASVGSGDTIAWDSSAYDGYTGIPGLPGAGTQVVASAPGTTFSFDAGNGRSVTVKDRRTASGKPVAVNVDALKAAMDASEVGPGNIEIRISNKEGVYGHAQVKPDGTHVVTINAKDKAYYPPAAAYVMNNSLVHELRHVTQAQTVPNFGSAYAAQSASEGYTDNKYEVEARSYGRFADHTGTKDGLPGDAKAVAGKVWAVLPL